MYHKRSKRALHSFAPVLIGVNGVEAGCGVTHSCITFATYEHRVKQRSVAYIEMNGSHQIHCLVKEEHSQGESFRYGGIVFYPDAGNMILQQVLNKGYDTVIIDFGCKYRQSPKYEIVCNEWFLLASGALWHQNKLESWLTNHDAMTSLQYKYLIPMVDEASILKLSRKYAVAFQAIPFQSNPFELTPSMIQFLAKLL